MIVNYCVLCEYALINVNTQPSMISIMDEVTAPLFPFVTPLFVVANISDYSRFDDLITSRLIDSNHDEIVSMKVSYRISGEGVNLPEDYKPSEFIIASLRSAVFEKPGLYYVVIECNGKSVYRQQLWIHLP